MWKRGCRPFALDPGSPVGRGFGGRLQVPEPVAVQVELREASGPDPKTAYPAV